jgi:hypothetical protein
MILMLVQLLLLLLYGIYGEGASRAFTVGSQSRTKKDESPSASEPG